MGGPPPPPDQLPVTWDNPMLMQLKGGVVPNVECLTYQHLQLNQTWRIIHLLWCILESYKDLC